LILGFEYGYSWPVYQAGKFSIKASIGASINTVLSADEWAVYAILLGVPGIPKLSADVALIMDFSVGGQ